MKYVAIQKYLGIEIKNDFTNDLNIMRQVKALYVGGNMLVKI